MKESRHHYLITREKGTIQKPFGLPCNIALIYPDNYEPAMSNLGFQVVYRYFNSFPEINCERFFYEKALPYSFENQRKASEFDVIAFSIPFEPGYLKAIEFLHRQNITIDKRKRKNSDPLIIGGGLAININPSPLKGCFDFLLPGDIEQYGSRLIQALLKGDTRWERLANLQEILCSPPYREIIKKSSGCSIPRHSQITTPCTTFKNKFLIEVTRGCPYRCRFCFIGNQQFPFSQCSWKSVKKVLSRQNNKNIGIISSAIGSWKGLTDFINYSRKHQYRVSFSSLRLDEINEEILGLLVDSGQQSLTLAPETGDESLRFSLNKNIVNEKIFSIVEKAFYRGLQQVKLYFMLGLPGENQETHNNTVRFLHILNNMVKKCSKKTGKAKRITIKFGIFVPKPRTPMAKTPLLEEKEIKTSFRFFKNQQKHLSSLSFDYDSIRSYFIQYLLSNYPTSLLSFFEDWCSSDKSQKSLINEYLGRLSHV